MYNIAIVDDDEIVCSQIEALLINYRQENNIALETHVFSSGEDFCQSLDKGLEIDLIFLDIQLFELSGIEVGKKIREQLNNYLTEIIFISAKEEYAMELFEIHPFNFLIKPLSGEKIIKNLELSLRIGNDNANYFLYRTGKDSKKVAAENIQYFESIKHKVIIHTTEGCDEFYGRLDEIYKQLKDTGFLFIHKSYLVNYKYINSFSYKAVGLKSGIELPISQARRKEIREKILDIEKAGVLSWD